MIINDKRALAYIVTIDEIRPIPNYDRVEHARTNGWWCVTRLNELKVGDKAVYFEVDSKVPADDERFSFLEAKHYKIKTQKMCGVFSQGLLMPVTLFPELADMEVGTDVTDILKVTYSVIEDNTRKSKNGDPDAKYKSMAQRHQKIFKKPIVRKIMKHKLGRKIMFLFFGKKKDKPLSFPTHFPFVHKTDEERCLIGDTKVQTNNGVLKIADIVNKELPVEVLSYNEKTKTVEYKPIISYQKFAKKEDEDLIEIKYPYRFGNQKTNTIRCTPDHKFYNGLTYVRADEIHQGDKIFIHHHCYDDYVIQVVFGMLLGDSSIYYDKRSGSNNIRIQTSQGEKQLDYLKMKQSLFGEQFFKIYKCKSGYCDNVVYKGCLSADYNISKAVLENCFINNKKTITPTMLKYITPLSLAIWYMDDGNLKHKYDSCSPSIIISTCGFSKNENELLIDMLRNNFGIECNLRREKNKYWSIYITTEGTKKFLKLITQYIPPCMRYKTLQEYENDYFSIQDLRYKKQERLMPIPVISIKKYKGIRRYKTVFDIEVKDNHNFFANNILTHNCENMPWVLGYERPLIVTEKLDGCLDRDVSVVTDAGSFKISEIVNKKLPVNVLTYNSNLNICEYKPIVDYHKWERVSDMYDIVVSQQGYKCGNKPKHIHCTSEHSFYVGNNQYIKAKDLKNTDIIYHRYEIIDTLVKEILLGILLGDASLSSKYGVINGGVDFSHSIKQKDYFNEIKRLLGQNISIDTTKSGYNSEMLRGHFYTNSEFKELSNKICVRNHKKYVTQEWANELTPISLAFWYMDDGTISNADSKLSRPTISIATNGFSYEECENLKRALSTKFNIESDIKMGESYKGNTLYMNTMNTAKFASLIAPYICDGMKYKLPKSMRNIKYCLGDYIASNGSSITPTKIISVRKIDNYNRKYVFDLTVKDNHNYFANGILTHNTSSTYILERKGKKKFEFYVLSRNVRQKTPDQKCYHDKNIYWDMAIKNNIEQRLKEYLIANPDLKYVCIQGESVGSVQGNPLKLNEDELYVFNFIRSDVGRLSSIDGKEIIESWGMKFVPILETEYYVPTDMETFKEYATAKSVVNPNVLREGIVLRDPTNDFSFKNVSREYLLKHGG